MASVAKKVLRFLNPVFFPVVAEDVIHRRFARRDGAHDARGVHEVFVVQVFRKAVAAPGAAAHGQRKRQAVIEIAAVGDGVSLVDDDAAHRHLHSKSLNMLIIICVYAAGVAVALIVVEGAQRAEGVVEIARLVQRHYR